LDLENGELAGMGHAGFAAERAVSAAVDEPAISEPMRILGDREHDESMKGSME
jgi:hypothetical protein